MMKKTDTIPSEVNTSTNTAKNDTQQPNNVKVEENTQSSVN